MRRVLSTSALALAAMLWLVPAAPAAVSEVSGGSAGDTLRLSLDACIDRALRLGEEMKQAEVQRKNAQAAYLQARSTALPQLSFSGSYTRQIESIYQQEGAFPSFEADTTKSLEQRVRELEQALPTAGYIAIAQLFSASSFASKNTWNAAVNLRQKIFQGGSIWGSIQAARHAMRAAELFLSDRKEGVVEQVRAAYLSALLADKGLSIARLGLEQATNQFEQVRLRAEAGNASEFDRLQAEVNRDNQLPAVTTAQGARDLAYLELARLCNLPGNAPVLLTTRLLNLNPEAGSPAPAPVDTLGLTEAALRASGVIALEQALEARNDAVTVARSNLFPNFSFFGSFAQQAFPPSNLPKRHDWLRNAYAGVQVDWTLFDGFMTKGTILQARAQREQARIDLAQTRELVRNAVIQGELELIRTSAELAARSRTVGLAKRALDLASLRFAEGASSNMEVNDQRIAWQLAQINEAAARRDYLLALAGLERYSGRPVFTDVARLGEGR